jgi:hypothetical protein
MRNFGRRSLPNITFMDKAVDALALQLHYCPARCPEQLRQWCYRRIDKLVAKLNKTEKALRRGTKDFRYEQHGDNCFIQLHDAAGEQHIWKVPTDWLETARQLWPVYVRKYPDGRHYVSKKVSVIQPDSSCLQKEVAVHRLFLGLGAVKRTKADAGEAQTDDGSWLNFCNDNIRPIKGSDLLDHCSQLNDAAANVSLDWKPTKAKLTTSHEKGLKNHLNRHEKSVVTFLSGKYPDEPKIILQN